MSMDFQASLFDLADGGTTHASGELSCPRLGRLGDTVHRHVLSRGAWVDVRRGWVSGSDEVFEALVQRVPWQAERRQMYEQVVDVPRLLRFYRAGEPLPHPLLLQARAALNDHYRDELGEEFTTAGMCYYRDGRDSVAWHGDTIGRSRREDTMVAIVSFGEARRLLLRPKRESASLRAVELRGRDQDRPKRESASLRAVELRGRDQDRPKRESASLAFSLGHGDLLVMGGSCQRTWEHAIPKTAKPVGPRISVQFRPHDVR